MKRYLFPLLLSSISVVLSFAAKPLQELQMYSADGSSYQSQVSSDQSYSALSTGQVSFYSNGGTGTMEPIVGLSDGQKIQLPRNTFVREGYCFVGWTNTPDSNEPFFQDEYDRFNYYSYNSALYAVWEPEESALRISFNANGGEGSMDPIYVRAGQVIIVPPHRFQSAEEGYECKGYGISPDDYARYRIGGTGSFTASCTLYAFWSPMDGSVGGASEKFKGQSIFVEGVNIAPEDWVQTSENPFKEFAEWNENCGWYDTDQGWFNFCWAATSSNVIHWWFDRNKEYIEKYRETHDFPEFLYHGKGISEVFGYFTNQWTQNIGGWANCGFNWFINGIDDGVQESAKGKGGIFKDVFGQNILVSSLGGTINRRIFNNFIVEALNNNDMLSIDESNYSGGHAIACWGADFDEEGYVKALYYTDSATPWNNSLTGRDLSLTKIDIRYHEDNNWKPYMATTVLIDGEIQHGEIPIIRIYRYSQGTEYWEAYFAAQGQESYTLECRDEDGNTFDTQTISIDPGSAIALPDYQFRTMTRAMAGERELTVGADGTIDVPEGIGNEITLYYADLLPFETTTVADGNFIDAHWYMFSSSGSGTPCMMIYDAQDNEHIAVKALTEADLLGDTGLWCIAGNVTGGFRLYNKAGGASLAVTYTGENGKAAMQTAEAEAAVWSIVPVSGEGESQAFCLKSLNGDGGNTALLLTDGEATFGHPDSSQAVLNAMNQTGGLTLAAEAFKSMLQNIPDRAVGAPLDRTATFETIETLKATPTATNYQAVRTAFENKIALSPDKAYRLIGTENQSNVAVADDGFLYTDDAGASDACGVFLLEPVKDGVYRMKVQGEYLGAAKSNNADNEFGLEGRNLSGSKIKKGEFAVIPASNARVYLQNTNTEAAGTTYVHLNGSTVAACGDQVRGTLWYMVEVPAMSVAIGESRYTTAHYPFAVQLPRNGALKAYTGTVGTNGNAREMVLTELSDDWIPAFTAVILVGDYVDTYNLPISVDDKVAVHNDNALQGTLLPSEITAEDYVLDYKDGVAAFYKVEDDEDLHIEANKAYLPSTSIPASAQGAEKFIFNFGDMSGVESITAETDGEEVYYDLQGRRVKNPSRGIYVTKSGKKILITR